MISVSSIIVKTCHGWYKLRVLVLYSENTGFLFIGGSWYKSPTAITLKPANSWDEEKPKISSNRWWICTRVMLETMEISSIIISFSSDIETLIWVFFWSDIVGRLSPVSLGIAKAVFTVVPSMFIAETPVGAIKSTVGSPGLVIVCLNVFTTEWYIVFIKWLLPAPAPPVIKR